MHQVPREDQIELADAIAEGARRRPQAFGEYFSTTTADRARLAPRTKAHIRCPKTRTPFVRAWTACSTASRTCAADVPKDVNKRLPLNAIILHLNDDHHWTRERIVAWLKSS